MTVAEIRADGVYIDGVKLPDCIKIPAGVVPRTFFATNGTRTETLDVTFVVDSVEIDHDSRFLTHAPTRLAMPQECGAVREPDGCWCRLPEGHAQMHQCRHVGDKLTVVEWSSKAKEAVR